MINHEASVMNRGSHSLKARAAASDKLTVFTALVLTHFGILAVLLIKHG